MKILINITYYTPHISGLTVYAKRLAEELVKKGHQVTVLTSKHESSLPSEEAINGVKIKRSNVLFKIGKGVIMPSLPFEALALVKWANVVNCHLPQPEAFWFLVFARIFGRKTVVTYHCDVRLPPGFTNWLVSQALLMSNFLNCLFATTIVNSSLDYIHSSPILRFFLKKTKIIYPPIKDFSRVPVNSDLKKKIASFKKKYKIGYVGRLATDKGVEYLFQSLPFLKKKLNSFGLFIVGPEKVIGEKKYQEKINQLTQKYHQDIFLLGKLIKPELASFFKTIDVLVLPSINSTEAFGMTQVEAMLCGTPVIASNLPGVRVPIKLTGMGEIVPIRNGQAIAEATIKILRNKKKYIKPKTKIKKIFSFQETINAYEKLFL